MLDNTVKRAPALNLNQSEAMWPRTLAVVPGGAQTFSKAPMQHVDGVSPKYIVRGKGAHVWDADDNQYIDYMCGLGPVILGHADEAVNQAAWNAMQQGVIASLPHPRETELSERLVSLIPCAEMVRFGKNGSDATTAAVRVARAHTRRDKVVVCGYHGWQDWYIGSTPRNLGVPRAVRDLTLTTPYNDIQALHRLFRENPDQIAGVILEPTNFVEPRDGFLQDLVELAHRRGALVIFDEIITGFRMAMGGAQEHFGVTPDLAAFGKAMANGFPISAVVGRAELMALFEKVFFSGTFGGELVSIAASLATIEALETRGAISHIHAMGRRLMEGYARIVAGLGLGDITHMIGYPWWPEYLFFDAAGQPSREVRSLFQQEIVRRGILTRAGMMISAAHGPEEIDGTLAAFKDALAVVGEAVRRNEVLDWLDGRVIEPVIRKVD